MLDERTVEVLALKLIKAEESRVPIDPISESYELGIDDAYRIQLKGVEMKKERGMIAVGKKIGLTSKRMQEYFGVYEPDYGHIMDKMMVFEGQPISLSELIQPKVEAEIAFYLEKELKGPGVNVASVLDATKWIMPAIEVIDSRIRDWKIKVEDSIADNGSSARVVLGGRAVEPLGVDLKHIGMAFERNGELVATGVGAEVLGNPAQSVAWLANKLSEFGVSLGKGEVVISGSLIPAVDVSPNDHFRATFDHLGSVSVKFVA